MPENGNAGEDPVDVWLRARRENKPYEAPIHGSDGSKRLVEAYEMGKLLGHGAFGHVHRATHVRTGTAFAIKVIPVPHGPAESESLFEENILRELNTMRRLSHPHIISVIEAFAPDRTAAPAGSQLAAHRPPREWHIVLELCSGSDLQQLVDRHGALEVDDVRVIAAQLTSAVQHMHEHGVIHRDIKAANVMVLGAELEGSSTVVKVLDFGLAFGLEDEFVELYKTAVSKTAAARATPISRRAGRRENLLRVFAQSVAGRAGGQGEASDSVHHGSKHGGSMHSAGSREMDSVLSDDRDASRHITFVAEPAGSRAYAPPEVTDSKRFTQSARGGVVVSMTPLVDAYALGALLRQLLTGVPPDRNVQQYIAQQTSSPAESLLQLLKACSGRPVKHYRYLSELPAPVVELLNGLMEHNVQRRMTVAQLGGKPWIAEAPGASALPFRRSNTPAARGSGRAAPGADRQAPSAVPAGPAAGRV